MIIPVGRVRVWWQRLAAKLRRRSAKPDLPPLAWHLWYAWRPVRVTPDDVVWLEGILRSRLCRGAGWSYRFTSEQAKKVQAPF
jgi:hypothetical protein